MLDAVGWLVGGLVALPSSALTQRGGSPGIEPHAEMSSYKQAVFRALTPKQGYVLPLTYTSICALTSGCMLDFNPAMQRSTAANTTPSRLAPAATAAAPGRATSRSPPARASPGGATVRSPTPAGPSASRLSQDHPPTAGLPQTPRGLNAAAVRCAARDIAVPRIRRTPAHARA